MADYMLQFVVPAIAGGITRLVRYMHVTKRAEANLFDACKETLGGSLAGIAGVNLLNPDGTLAQQIGIAMTSGVSGIWWIMSRGDVKPEQEKQLEQQSIAAPEKAADEILKTPEKPADSNEDLASILLELRQTKEEISRKLAEKDEKAQTKQ